MSKSWWNVFCLTVKVLVLVSLSIGVYYNSLNNDFTFDDSLALVNNGDVTSDTQSLQLWGNDLWGKDIRAHDSHKSYRPLLIKAFQLISKYINNKPISFRLFNIAFHVICTLLVFSLGRTITKNGHISFSSAVLFATHPIHVEAVASIVNMAEAIHTILVILAFFIFHQSIMYSARRPLWRLVISTAVWVLFVVVAILFKETGLIACALIFAKTVMEIILYTIRKLRGTLYADSSPQQAHTMVDRIRHRTRMILLYAYWNALAMFMCYLYFSFRSLLINADRAELLSSGHHFLYRLLVNPALISGPGSSAAGSYLGSSQLIRKAENPFSFLVGQEKVLSMLYLHFRYMYQLLYPAQQSPEYSFNCIPSVPGLADPRNLCWLATYMSVVVLGLWGIYVSTCKDASSGPTTIIAAPVKNERVNVTADSDQSSTDDKCQSTTDVKNNKADGNDSRLFDLSSTAVLDSLIWLVVPFVPASGVVFKLGTLLAERLLYMSSIGYCFLLCILLYSLIIGVVVGVSGLCGVRRGSRASTYMRWCALLVYWVSIAGITMFYVHRTVDYNTVWLNNETLFIRSLEVCPNSAKMHVQVSKVYSNKHDFLTARKHVMRAKEIDPDFCDVGYQEALLSISIDNSAEDALAHALGNLKCVFSNSGSMQLVNQLWQLEINAHVGPNRQMGLFKTLAKQAAQALAAGLDMLAAKKYMEASSVASEAKQYKKAISLSAQSEKTMLLVLDENRNASAAGNYDDIAPVPDELKCRIYLLSGTHRAFYSDHIAAVNSRPENKLNKIKVDKNIKKELSRTKELLFKAIEPECVMFSTPANGNQLHVALNYLSGIVTAEVDQSKVETLEAYAQLLSKSYRMLTLQQDLQKQQAQSVGAASNEAEASALAVVGPTTPQAAETAQQSPFGNLLNIRSNAGSVWNTVGLKHHGEGDFDEAIECFEESLKLFTVLPPSPPPQSQSGAVEDSGLVVTTALMQKHLPSLDLTQVSCNSLYWYSDALAGQSSFARSESQVRLVIRALRTYLRCEMQGAQRDGVVKMIDKLESYLKPPPSAPSTPAAVTADGIKRSAVVSEEDDDEL